MNNVLIFRNLASRVRGLPECFAKSSFSEYKDITIFSIRKIIKEIFL